MGKTIYKFRYQVAVWLIIALFVSSCGLTHKVARKIRPWHGILKKRVMVNPLLDQAGIGQAYTQAITAKLIQFLRSNDNLIVFLTPFEKHLQLDPKSLGFGIVISPKLIEKAKNTGMNALITGVINPVEITEKKKGFWPFKKVVKNIEVSVFLNLLDIASETLLLTKVFSKNITVSMDEARDINAQEFKIEAVQKIIPDLLKDFTEQVEDALAEEPWIGTILSVDQYIKINAGADVGLEPGKRFAVFKPGKEVESLDKMRFPLYWKKIGEIQVVKVGEKESLAKPIRGKGFEQGQRIEFIN